MNRCVALAFAALSTAILSTAPRAVAAPSAGAARAAEQPDAKAMIERNKKCLREFSAHASKVTFDRKDLEKYLAEWRSFDALGLGESEEGPDGPKCLGLADAVKEPAYVAWARERRLDPKDWLLKSLRISLTDTKRRAPAEAAEMKSQMEAQRREMAKHCKSMGPDACGQMEKAFAQGDELMKENAAMMALLPEPTRSEAALLAEYDARLRETTEGGRRGRHRGGEVPDEDPGEAPADEGQPR